MNTTEEHLSSHEDETIDQIDEDEQMNDGAFFGASDDNSSDDSDQEDEPAVFQWIEENNLEKLEKFLDTQDENEIVTIFTLENAKEDTLLHVAAQNGRTEAVKKLLDFYAKHIEQSPFPKRDILNPLNPNGYSPFQLAALRAQKDTCLVFLAETHRFPRSLHPLKCGSKNEVYRDMTALHLAAMKNHTSLIHAFLESIRHDVALTHSIVNSLTEDGRTPLHVAIHNVTSGNWVDLEDFPIIANAKNPHVKELLHGEKSFFFVNDDNIHDSLVTPLMLIEMGADAGLADSAGYTPLILAIGKNKKILTKFLIDICQVDINTPDRNGDTPLHHAFQMQLQKLFNGNWPVPALNHELALMLVSAPHQLCNVNATNMDGFSAFEYASPSMKEMFVTVNRLSKDVKKKIPDMDYFLSVFSSDDFRSIYGKGLTQLMTQEDQEILKKCVPAVAKEQKEATEEEESRGGCTFISSKKKGSKEEASSAAGDAPKCPFMSSNKKADANNEELKSKCPFASKSDVSIPAPKTPEVTDVKEGDNVSLPLKKKEGKCPIPFHNQLMDPKYWLFGSLLIVGLAYGTRMMLF